MKRNTVRKAMTSAGKRAIGTILKICESPNLKGIGADTIADLLSTFKGRPLEEIDIEEVRELRVTWAAMTEDSLIDYYEEVINKNDFIVFLRITKALYDLENILDLLAEND